MRVSRISRPSAAMVQFGLVPVVSPDLCCAGFLSGLSGTGGSRPVQCLHCPSSLAGNSRRYPVPSRGEWRPGGPEVRCSGERRAPIGGSALDRADILNYGGPG